MLQVRTEESRRLKARAEELGESRPEGGRDSSMGCFFVVGDGVPPTIHITWKVTHVVQGYSKGTISSPPH